ncbi:MAG: TSUP family transporter [Sphingomonadales bacterium]|nr:TSUP family transporter [Sphingomonadales bacterium]
MDLSLTAYAALTAVAVLAGFVDSVAGGGGLITVPALLYAGLPPTVMLGTNKAQSVCGTALATLRYHRAGLFALRPNLPLVGFVLAGAALGAWTIQRIDAGVLKLLIPLLLIGVALYTLFSPRMHDHDGEPTLGTRGYWPFGSGIGFYDGFFGPGTGQFFAITLVSLRGLGLTRATGLTKLLNLTSNLASVAVFAWGGNIRWKLAACMACGAMSGAWAGSHTATRHGARVIRPMLITVSLALTANLVRQWFNG